MGRLDLEYRTDGGRDKESLGQHWLQPRQLADHGNAADVQWSNSEKKSARYGTLTEFCWRLVPRCSGIDQDLLKVPRNRFDGGANFKFVHGDIRTFNFHRLPAG